ncbi:hypothetical protein XENTR_v10010323 [Xenopus tropicalis]|uniref:Vitelline membrane outer layer protein 1 homolog n=1 Tax=Xenopus tropicalis TaxID=8364 RepID=A0A6I8RHE6_XENTR|nr:hypothetical protein XENTR_v10010323 [Xenopus tropicalis]
MMAIKVFLVIVSLFFIGYGRLNPSIITAANGGPWGVWGPLEECPRGCVAKKFSLKIQENVLDDTALNGIRLHCSKYNSTDEVSTVTSTVAAYGNWCRPYSCEKGFFNAFSLRVEPHQGYLLDDTAANNIKFKCSGKGEVEGPGLKWGSYGPWSQTCEFGICGIMTKVETAGQYFDHTSLNDVQFHCCPRRAQ